MAGNIKGITIEFRGDTTQLDKALRQVNNETKKIDNELKNVNRALKFNPTSVDLWRQKQQLLTQKIGETEDKLELLKKQQEQMDADKVDKNSEEYRKLQREIIETESKLKTFKAQLRQVGNVKLKALSEQFKQIGKKMTETGKNLTMKVTAPLVAVGAVATNKFAEVDKVMQLTNSTMGNTEEQAQLLNTAMKEAAASSTYGMQDAANATLNFARAGLTAEQAASTLAPAMALAAGEGGELDTVSAGLVATINGFGDSFENAGTYADVFANACNNSALDVNSLSNAMSVAAPIFSAAGYSVNDAALYMGIMANNGIEADKAANSLKTGLARLISPAKDGAEMMAELGLYTDEGGSAFENLDGSMKSTIEIQQLLHDSFGALSESEQIAAASAIFGKNQMAPWLALINTAPEDVGELNTALGENGTALEMQADMMSGFGGSIEQLKSGIDVLATSIGESLAPILQVVIDGLQKLINWFNSLSPATQSVISVIGVLIAAIGPVLVIVGTLASSIGSIIGLVGTISTALPALGTAFAALAAPVGIAIAAIAAIIAIGILLYKNWDKIKAMAARFKDAVVKIFNDFKAKVTSTFNAIKDAIVTPIKNAIDKVKGIIEKIKGFFPIKVGNLFGHIDLPHFNITWESVGGTKLKIPKFNGIKWYASGGIFDSPSVIGVGEAGAEAVVPLDKLWDKLDNMHGETNIVINVNGANKDPKEIAQEVKRILIREVKSQSLVYG